MQIRLTAPPGTVILVGLIVYYVGVAGVQCETDTSGAGASTSSSGSQSGGKKKVRRKIVFVSPLYRVSHLLVDLGWVDFYLGVPPSWPAAQPLLPNSHQPNQHNQQTAEHSKSKANPTQSTSRWDTL